MGEYLAMQASLRCAREAAEVVWRHRNALLPQLDYRESEILRRFVADFTAGLEKEEADDTRVVNSWHCYLCRAWGGSYVTEEESQAALAVHLKEAHPR